MIMNNVPSPQDQLMRFILAKWISKPIYAVSALGIPDLLAQGPRSIAELAELTDTCSDTLYRVLRALASVGIFSEGEDRCFQLTPMASLLQSGRLRAAALSFNSPWNDRAWTGLSDALRSGDTPFEQIFGCPLSDWLKDNPGDADLLHQANAARAAQTHQAVLGSYDFSHLSSLTDVGGGYGELITEILIAYPQLKGSVADLATAREGAGKVIREKGLQERCSVMECDFFASVPAGSDAYLLANVLHDWPDEKAGTILKNCRRAMRGDSILLILEMLVPPGNQPSAAKLLDLEMLVVTGGRERTESEFRQLLAAAGLDLKRILPASPELFLLEALPV
jgi:hypothetical protein